MGKEIVREEEKGRFFEGSNGKVYNRGNVVYSRRDKEGEGFGKRKVGMRVKIRKYSENGFSLLEGIIVRIVRRINGSYYDYWYKVELENGKYIWGSYVII